MKRYIHHLVKVIFILGLTTLLYFVIRLNFFLPEPGSYNYDTVNELRSQCLKEVNPGLFYEPRPRDYLIDIEIMPPRPECLFSITNVYFFRDDVFWDISQVYAIESSDAIREHDYGLGVLYVLESMLYNLHHIIIKYSPFLLFIHWLVVGVYLLSYDNIPDLFERAIEGFGAGMFASSWGYYGRMLNWEYFGFDFNSTPIILWTTGAVLFLSIDIRKRQLDNLFTKLILFFVGILLITLIGYSLGLDANYVITPFITASIAVFYHYWRKLKSTRLKLGSLAYSIAFLGFIAAIVKHQDLLISNSFGHTRFSNANLSEFFLDLVILLLGVLLTFLELSKPSEESSKIKHASQHTLPEIASLPSKNDTTIATIQYDSHEKLSVGSKNNVVSIFYWLYLSLGCIMFVTWFRFYKKRQQK